jgi:hypothetical protein
VTAATGWLVDRVSRLLDPDERDAVRGDFAELGITSAQAVVEILELVVRRQAALWTEWGPWLALVGVVIPLGVVLGQLSWSWADGSAIYGFLYVNNWTWAYLESPGARRDLLDISTRVCVNDLALIGWSWTGGFALGSLSRRTLWVTATLFCVVVFVVFGSSSGTMARANPFNAAVFSLTFYRIVYPWLVLTALVLLPAAWGMRRSRRSASLSLMPTILGVLLVAMLTASATRPLELSMIDRWHLTRLDPAPDGFVGAANGFRPLLLLPLLLVWPAAFIFASTCWRRWRGQSASA